MISSSTNIGPNLVSYLSNNYMRANLGQYIVSLGTETIATRWQKIILRLPEVVGLFINKKLVLSVDFV